MCQAQTTTLMPKLVFWIHDLKSRYAARREDSESEAVGRAKFLGAIEALLLPLVTGVQVATKAALLSPESVGIEKLLTKEDINLCWEEILGEVLLFENGDARLAEAANAMTSAVVQFSRATLELARVNAVAGMTFEGFWNAHKVSLAQLLPIARLYGAMPASSVKPETVFSYTGRLVSKRASAWGVESVEAQAIINDFTRQSDYSFGIVLEEVEELKKEWKKRKMEAKTALLEAKGSALQAQLDQIEADKAELMVESSDDDSGDDPGPAGS